jgi:hypothetical protein
LNHFKTFSANHDHPIKNRASYKMISKILLKIFYLALCMTFLACPSHAKRLALIIGNDTYTNPDVPKLLKARNDATAMANELKLAGFEINLNKDLNYKNMVKAIDNFTDKITGGDEVVVFYAGHGVQLKSGNYLLPTDIEPNSSAEVEKTAFSIEDLRDKLNDARPSFTLIIADACRAPLQSNGRGLSTSRGLGAVDAAKGQMIIQSASRGQEALDRLSQNDPNPNSVFTREFISRMRKPGVRIEDMVREVQNAVEELAKSVKHEQRPAITNESRGNFYFYAPTTIQVDTTPPQTFNIAAPMQTLDQKEDTFWNDVKNTGNVQAFEAYLESYPKGRYSSLAKANISRLTIPTPQIIPSVTPTQQAYNPIATVPQIRQPYEPTPSDRSARQPYHPNAYTTHTEESYSASPSVSGARRPYQPNP